MILLSVLESYNQSYNFLEEKRIEVAEEEHNRYIDIRRTSLEMKRALLNKQGKLNESIVVLDKLIELESIDAGMGYGLFSLEMLKFNAMSSVNNDKEIIFERNEEMLNLLDSIYKKYEKVYDNDYYFYRYYHGDITEQYLVGELSKFQNLIDETKFIKDLSYKNQINIYTKIYREFQGLQTTLFTFLMAANPNMQDLALKYILDFEKFFDLRLKVDNMDVYNTALLNMNYEKTEEYFKLLNMTFDEKDYDKLKLAYNNFDLFQQENKVSLKFKSGNFIREFSSQHEK